MSPLLEFTPAQWRDGMDKALGALSVPGTRVVVLGDIPILPQAAPQCLPLHTMSVQDCSGTPQTRWTPFNRAERAAAAARHVQYIDTSPWFCALGACPAVIGHFEVYSDRDHVTAAYAQYLSKVLGQRLGLLPAS
jgi:hypothetical protein